MNRRALFALLAGSPGKGSITEPGCSHTWVTGPYYVTVAVTYEEPSFYPPNGTTNVDHCSSCGLLRLGAEPRRHTGRNYNATPDGKP